MAIAVPACSCPQDSKVTALAKTNNNLVALFFIMSAAQFRGYTISFSNCLCSELQILAVLNNNLSRFFTWLSANGGAPVDASVGSWADLAAIPTAALNTGALKIWVNSGTGVLMATQLLAGTDATDTANGVQRPNDYAEPSNEKVWFNKL